MNLSRSKMNFFEVYFTIKVFFKSLYALCATDFPFCKDNLVTGARFAILLRNCKNCAILTLVYKKQGSRIFLERL